MNIEIHDAALEARIQKQLQATGSASVEEVLLRLLETQEDDTAQLVAPVRMERDWKSADAEEDKDIAEEEEEENIHGWRPGATDSDVDDVPAGKQDWREVAFANITDTPARNA